MNLTNKLNHYFEKGFNCLLRGDHGVGKTAIVMECFEKQGLVIGESALIFSAATMDPWVDFIGVPKEVTKDGNTYLDFILPKHFAEDKVEAIFFDEFNRSHKKIRNAVMELIQFKSINGRKFNNLKVVWAAINPSDSDLHEYDVEVLDPAQEDRFHISVNVPFAPDLSYFTKKYGKKIAEGVVHWWRRIPKEIQKKVSPRRLEYAIEVSIAEGDLADVLPAKSNPRGLAKILMHGSPLQHFATLMGKGGTDENLQHFLEDPNNVKACMETIIEKTGAMRRCFPMIGDELMASAFVDYKKVQNHICKTINCTKGQDVKNYRFSNELPKYTRILSEVSSISGNPQEKKLARKTLEDCVPGYQMLVDDSLTLYGMTESVDARYNIKIQDRFESSLKDQKFVEGKLSYFLEVLNSTKYDSRKAKILMEASLLIHKHTASARHAETVFKLLSASEKLILESQSREAKLYLSEWVANAYYSKNGKTKESTHYIINKIGSFYSKEIVKAIEASKFPLYELNEKAEAFGVLIS